MIDIAVVVLTKDEEVNVDDGKLTAEGQGLRVNS